MGAKAMPNINSRLSALSETLRARRAVAAMPVDPLSLSLRELGQELRDGGAAMLLTLTDEDGRQILDPDGAERMAEDWG